MSNSFSAMILAAGYGRRMLPLTSNLPKPLIKIKGVRLIDNIINFLQSLGCKQIVINTHYQHEKITQAIRKNNFAKNRKAEKFETKIKKNLMIKLKIF